MESILSKFNIVANANTFIKDPVSSELGKKIVSMGIEMIDEIGFEQFTFRKLAAAINSTEASVYRYFESKHKFLLYLTAWYWAWTEYRLLFATVNVTDPKVRLTAALKIITDEIQEDGNFEHISEVRLNRIVNCESSKSYLTKDVDSVNKEGVFLDYKQVVSRISDIILEINPNYKYPHMLVSTVVEGTHLERFFAKHLPRLTDNVKGEDSVTAFYHDLVFRAIA